jgi:hypothetical protein
MNASDYRWVDDATVDLDANGDAAVAWVDQERKDVFFQRYGPDGKPRLQAPTNVARSPTTFSWLPRVVVAPSDSARVHVLWQEIVFSGGSHGGEIFFARSSDGGVTFSEPLNLSSSQAGDGKGRLDAEIWDNGSLDLARGPAGQLFAAWSEYEGALWFRLSADGERFSAPVRIGGDAAAPARAPSIAAGPSGSVHVAWTVGENPGADIHVARSGDGGRSFGPPLHVGASAGHSDAPKLATDRDGNVHLVYAESPSGRRGPYHVRYSRLKGGASTFEEPRRISSRDDRGSAGESFPAVSVDGSNRVLVIWEKLRSGDTRPRGLGYATSRDGGERFTAPADVPGITGEALGWNGSQQGMLTDKLAVDAAGAVAIVNSTFDPGRASHVWLARGRVID